jgi:hypothetical protein
LEFGDFFLANKPEEVELVILLLLELLLKDLDYFDSLVGESQIICFNFIEGKVFATLFD